MIWGFFAEQQISTGNPLLDSAYYVFGVGAFLLGALVVALMYMTREKSKGDGRIAALEEKVDKLQESRLQDQKDVGQQQIAPLNELKNFVGALYEQFRNSNGSKGQ